MVRMTAAKAHLGALATFLLALLAQVTGLVEAPAAEELDAAGQELTAVLVELATSAIGAGVTWVVVYFGRNRPKPPADDGPQNIGMRCAPVAVLLAILLLAGCVPATQRLDAATGTTLEERCLSYQATLVAASLLAEPDKRTVAKLQALIDLTCLPPAPRLDLPPP